MIGGFQKLVLVISMEVVDCLVKELVTMVVKEFEKFVYHFCELEFWFLPLIKFVSEFGDDE
jgi:hypothetical protein